MNIRGLSPELRRRLAEVAGTRGEPLDCAVVALLEEGVVLARRQRLRRYVNWTRRDVAVMERSIREQRRVAKR